MQFRTGAESRISDLERQLRFLRFSVFGLLLLIVMAIVTMVRTSSVRADDGAIIRTRGIVIEDAQGRPRILLGAPIPVVQGRKRKGDLTNGLLLLGENGADRLVVGDALQPEVAGKVELRKGTEGASGFWINDSDGNERGGYITSGDSALLTLDYRNSDAFHLTAGTDSASMVLRAPGDRPRAMLVTEGDRPAKLLFFHSGEVNMLRINEQTTKPLPPVKSDKEFFEVLRNTNP